MKARITALILEELEAAATALEESDEDPFYIANLRAGIDKMRRGVRPLSGWYGESPEVLRDIKEEMVCISSKDIFTQGAGRRQWIEAAAWLGLLEPYNPDAVVLGRKPKVVTVDGKKYEV